MRNRRLSFICLSLLLVAVSLAGEKKNPDDVTQTRVVPKDLPQVAVAEASRLLFHVSPLSGTGLLSQQTRVALKALLKDNGGVSVVHVRAFVAGGGDIRRVPQIVAEVFTERKLPLPSVSVVLAGGLPLENAQVVIEAVSVAKKDVNPGGVAFVAGEAATGDDPSSPVRPLLEKALESLAAGLRGATALQVSCYVSTLPNPAELSAAIAARFPSAAVDLVQTQRAAFRALARCEAVARRPGGSAGRLAFTGTRVAFGSQEKDATLAFQRLDRDLAEALAPASGIVVSHVYSLSGQASDMVRQMRPGTMVIPFEGLASVEAGFAVDAVAGLPVAVLPVAVFQ